MLIHKALDLPPNVMPPVKPYSGKPRKMRHTISKLIRYEVLAANISAVQLKKKYPKLLGNITIPRSFTECVPIALPHCCQKIPLNGKDEA